jgi:hypothetical protein
MNVIYFSVKITAIIDIKFKMKLVLMLKFTGMEFEVYFIEVEIED